MGLEIQGAVNSMIGSANSIVQQEQENRRKALSIALAAATGGTSAALGAVAKNAGVSVPTTTGQVHGGSNDSQSLQDTAARIALQNSQQAVEFKKAQKEKFNLMRRSLNGEH